MLNPPLLAFRPPLASVVPSAGAFSPSRAARAADCAEQAAAVGDPGPQAAAIELHGGQVRGVLPEDQLPDARGGAGGAACKACQERHSLGALLPMSLPVSPSLFVLQLRALLLPYPGLRTPVNHP